MSSDEGALRRRLHEDNRLSWNAATAAHLRHRTDVGARFRAGQGKLYPEERELLGNINGLDVVHLQCNDGRDTLSLALLGARVTGVDISDVAIEAANGLSAESGVPARFVRADVYDWLAETSAGDERFDVAFSSYGAIVWLSDLRRWARGIAAVLRSGGRFVLMEFHPFPLLWDWDGVRRYPYFGWGEALTEEGGVGDYVADTLAARSGEPLGERFQNPHPVHEFDWPVSEVITALLDAGLRLEVFREYPHANGWNMFPTYRPLDGGRFTVPENEPNLPLMYGVVARKD